MSQPPPPSNGAVAWRPRLPTWAVVVPVAVSLVAVSGLIYLLYSRTRGPAEILRDFAALVDDRDCPGSYDLLDGRIQDRLTEEAWCDRLTEVDAALNEDFTLQRSLYQRDSEVARVQISGSPIREWPLIRHGNSWRMLLPPELEGSP